MSGGTFCRFYAGQPGRSVSHLRYISRPGAVVDRWKGVFGYNLPETVMQAASYEGFRDNLLAYSWMREESEKKEGIPSRTHYTALFSFEREVSLTQVKTLVKEWLKECFPLGRGVVCLHGNTKHLHAHLWLDARQTDDRKIHLSAREYRQLDEVWNRLYSQTMGRNEGEHLHKKWETERAKTLQREGTDICLPERVNHHWNPQMFTQRERERLMGEYECKERGVGSDQSSTTRSPSYLTLPERTSSSREPAVEAAIKNAVRAVSETEALHQTLTQLVEQNKEIDRER